MAESNVSEILQNVEYEDKSVKKVIGPSDLVTMVWRSLFLQASFNYERMQACGWLYGILPALKKIHTNKKDLSKSMLMHMEFFNTHPFLVNFIMGLVVAMVSVMPSAGCLCCLLLLVLVLLWLWELIRIRPVLSYSWYCSISYTLLCVSA